MGDYVTQAELIVRLGTPLLVGLTNSDQTATTIDTDALDQAIGEAEGELNGYLSAEYTLPLTGSLPTIVKSLARRMAVYHIYQLAPGTVEPGIQADYDRAIKTCGAIASGKMKLGLDTDGDADDTADSSSATVRHGGNARRLTRSGMRGF